MLLEPIQILSALKMAYDYHDQLDSTSASRS